LPLFIIGGLPIAVRVLIADAIPNGCGAVLSLSPITRLIGRGDTTRSRRLRRQLSDGIQRQRCRSKAACERADAERSRKLLAVSARGAFIQA
jgi:hypothetical protein